METIRGQALVIKVTDWSETSKIATLWMRDYGKLRVLAKGARRLRSPFEVSLDFFNVCSIVLLRKTTRNLELLTEAQLVERFPELRKNLDALYAGYYLAELLDDGMQENDPHPDLWELSLGILRQLSQISASNPNSPVPQSIPDTKDALLSEQPVNSMDSSHLTTLQTEKWLEQGERRSEDKGEDRISENLNEKQDLSVLPLSNGEGNGERNGVINGGEETEERERSRIREPEVDKQSKEVDYPADVLNALEKKHDNRLNSETEIWRRAAIATLVSHFEWSWIRSLGYFPNLKECVHCSLPVAWSKQSIESKNEIQGIEKATKLDRRKSADHRDHHDWWIGGTVGGTVCHRCRFNHRGLLLLKESVWQWLVQEELRIKQNLMLLQDRIEEIRGDDRRESNFDLRQETLTVLDSPLRQDLRRIAGLFIASIIGHQPKLWPYLPT